AKKLGKDPATVSKWCTNTAQPSLETLTAIAECLNVDIRSLLNSTNDAMVAETSISFVNYEGK
ncbi:MAG: helix-turn-helix transcriptional regulator, partial [Muribaculaceae bacterium]|nr:helix-turn-helix transcriptional regulator [Muribaculaceae bacterium]